MKLWACAYEGPELFSMSNDMVVYFTEDEAQAAVNEARKATRQLYSLYSLDLTKTNPIFWKLEGQD
tara:strand:- start:434 stop:631 length:198 start_codon:yes stop_codon:yes gene_type:complete